ncbi:MAG: hypothetical protein H3C48_16290 [Chitinophagaceae bacterium]|nr:hypothetical protein [Chitinophagaceae bacterium]
MLYRTKGNDTPRIYPGLQLLVKIPDNGIAILNTNVGEKSGLSLLEFDILFLIFVNYNNNEKQNKLY